LPLMCCILSTYLMFSLVRVFVPTYTWSSTVKKSTKCG
jgi:hypothetical protein